MENCNIKPITLQRHCLEVTGNRVKLLLSKKHLYQGLSINSCCVMLMRSKMLYCGASLQSGTSLVVSFAKIFSISDTYFQEHLRVFFIFLFFFANRNSCGYYFRRFGNFPRERLQ